MNSSVKIGLRALLLAMVILLALMIFSGVLTRIMPSGSFQRDVVNGITVINPDSYQTIAKPDYPVWRWFTAPIEVLFSSGNLALITIILFLLFVGGSITILEQVGVMEYLVKFLIRKFYARRYLLMALVILLFMSLASFLGIYEGMVPLIIFIVPMARKMGWDSLTGLGMSLLPMAFGFASSVTNPFTVAVAQIIAELPVFSGAWLRLIFFLIVYAIVFLFVRGYARRIEKNPEASRSRKEDRALANDDSAQEDVIAEEEREDPAAHAHLVRALLWFSSLLGLAFAVVFITSFFPDISDYAFPVMGLLFFIGGVGAGLLSGHRIGQVAKIFITGVANIFPAVILILMAYSVKYIIDQGQITDTILYRASSLIRNSNTLSAAMLVYALTLAMNFFIGSASAKAFLMMPILTPLSDIVGLHRQTAVLAFGFGDGFSNMLFPTNALLLIALSFTVVSYPKWIRWTWPLQLTMAGLSVGFLIFAVVVGYGPF